MRNQFAKRASLVKSSETREIFKVTERPEVISFAGGFPAPELFPVEELHVACEAVLKEDGPTPLQYSTTEGYIPLRNAIIKRMDAIGYSSAFTANLDYVRFPAGY
ncbi:2-aminoadipate transaminase [Peribacillus sp. Bi96]|uniref:hypothetical protein n=1 Tax=unclassified Peribacillus TaxID=2675266 RepID=UPI001DC63DA4|nr:hypothetical protein [Peribacillus sp. Bi96]CAH0174355.1 2-aminoadipate transaminase [Peribacillus sp. Bi96]